LSLRTKYISISGRTEELASIQINLQLARITIMCVDRKKKNVVTLVLADWKISK
jgi:hypothetical protein